MCAVLLLPSIAPYLCLQRVATRYGSELSRAYPRDYVKKSRLVKSSFWHRFSADVKVDDDMRKKDYRFGRSQECTIWYSAEAKNAHYGI